MSIRGIGTIDYPMVGYETKRTETNMSENQFMDTLIEKESTDKSSHAEKAFHSVAPNAPEKVKTAWMETAARDWHRWHGQDEKRNDGTYIPDAGAAV